eukprot:2298738-Prymnesium_polylepis.3
MYRIPSWTASRPASDGGVFLCSAKGDALHAHQLRAELEMTLGRACTVERPACCDADEAAAHQPHGPSSNLGSGAVQYGVQLVTVTSQGYASRTQALRSLPPLATSLASRNVVISCLWQSPVRATTMQRQPTSTKSCRRRWTRRSRSSCKSCCPAV